MEVQQYGVLNAAMRSKYATEQISTWDCHMRAMPLACSAHTAIKTVMQQILFLSFVKYYPHDKFTVYSKRPTKHKQKQEEGSGQQGEMEACTAKCW